jgi:hypothetical protein
MTTTWRTPRLRWTARPSQRFLGIIAGAGIALAGLGLATTANAQDDDILDALRAEVPESFPGKSDLTEANEEFGRLVAIYGASTEVADFGDGSVLTGLCGGYAYSFDQDGNLIDAAMDLGDDSPPVDIVDGGQAFTSSNPFKVDTRGLVQYFGFAPRDGDGPQNHTWEIRTSGISLDKGGDPNPNLKNRNSGIVDLAEDLPVKFSAKVKVDGFMKSLNQPDCIGKGHVEFIGNGLTDPVGLGALALLGGGLFGLLFNARPAYTYRSGG